MAPGKRRSRHEAAVAGAEGGAAPQTGRQRGGLVAQCAVAAVPVALAVALFFGTWQEWLLYRRDAVAAGEWWRLFSAPFVHLEPAHLALNLVAWLLLCAYAQGAVPVSVWVLTALVSSGVCGLGLHLFNAELDWVVGLSGLLHGMAVMVALYRWRQLQDWTGLLLLALVALKLCWEQWFGPTPGTAQLLEMAVVVDAHLYGALGALCLAPWFWRPGGATAVGTPVGAVRG